MRIHRLLCGWLGADARTFFAGEDGRVRLPIGAYLIEHPRGTVLFDTGLHPQVITDARGRIGGVADLFELELTTDLPEAIAAADVDPTGIGIIVNSHLHFDHCGGNTLLPHARFVVQRAEWEHARGIDGPGGGYAPSDFDTGQDVELVDGEHDLFGDGRVVCIPTPGHTAGHQSLLVRLDDGDVVLAGDACYLARLLDDLQLPIFGYDLGEQRRSMMKIRDLRDAGAEILYSHEPDQWPQA